MFYSDYILFSILFYSILFYSILFYSINLIKILFAPFPQMEKQLLWAVFVQSVLLTSKVLYKILKPD